MIARKVPRRETPSKFNFVFQSSTLHKYPDGFRFGFSNHSIIWILCKAQVERGRFKSAKCKLVGGELSWAFQPVGGMED